MTEAASRLQGGSTQPTLATTFPAIPEAITRMRHDAAAFAARNGASEELTVDVSLVVSEAVTNAVKYAYGAEGEGTVELTASVDDGFLEIGVRDNGDGFGSGSSDGLGLGLSIIARLCAEMTVVQGGDGTEVRMRFVLPTG